MKLALLSFAALLALAPSAFAQSANDGIACVETLNASNKLHGQFTVNLRNYVMSQICEIDMDPSLKGADFFTSNAWYNMTHEEKKSALADCRETIQSEILGVESGETVLNLSKKQTDDLTTGLLKLGLSKAKIKSLLAIASSKQLVQQLTMALLENRQAQVTIDSDETYNTRTPENERVQAQGLIKAYSLEPVNSLKPDFRSSVLKMSDVSFITLNSVLYYANFQMSTAPAEAILKAGFDPATVRVSALNMARGLGGRSGSNFVDLGITSPNFLTVVDKNEQVHVLKMTGQGATAKTVEVGQGPLGQEIAVNDAVSYLNGRGQQNSAFKVTCSK